MNVGVSPTAIRMHRLQTAHRPHELEHELRVAIEELSEFAADDFAKVVIRYGEVEATIAIDFDQYGLSRMVYERAMDFRPFFALYRSKVRMTYDYVEPLSDEAAVRCVNLAYKMMLCKLESEPSVDDTIFLAWRGLLELS